MNQILKGGIDKMKEAGVAVIGGHSINDPEIKAGFAVTGTIDKDKIVTNAGAQKGDVLILTKPLGTGIVAFAAQIERAESKSIEAAAKSMTTLNKKASQLMVEFGAHACTDVTGFSLMGHLTELALRSGVDAEITWDYLPFFPGVPGYVADGILPGAVERNKESCGQMVIAGDNVNSDMVDMCFDAQTSGGLLIAIAENKADGFLKKLHGEGVSHATIIGRIKQKGSGRVFVETTGERKMPKPADKTETGTKPVTSEAKKQKETIQVTTGQGGSACCAQASTSPNSDDLTGVKAIQADYSKFLSSVATPSGLDGFTKQAVNIALSVLSRCEDCLKIHNKKAKKMGFSDEEIDEAAWMGIAFGGSAVMMFYKSLSEKA